MVDNSKVGFDDWWKTNRNDLMHLRIADAHYELCEAAYLAGAAAERESIIGIPKLITERGHIMALGTHVVDYKPEAWEQYTMQELGWWVHLFTKRAGHRENPVKREKDLYDAQNYLSMMQSKLDALK